MSVLSQAVAARTTGFVSTLTALTLLPVVCVSLISEGTALLPLLAALLASSLGTEVAFRILRRQPVTFHTLTTAILMSVLLPTDVALWQAASMTILGVTLAEMVFGGRGFGFLNAAVVSAVLLLVSFPGTGLAELGDLHAVAAVPAILVFLLADLLPWRTLAAFGLACVLLATTTTTPFAGAVGALAVAAVFCLCDPFASAQTRSGQVIQGLLAAMIYSALANADASATETVIRSVLLTALFLPLVDQTVQTIGRRVRV